MATTNLVPPAIEPSSNLEIIDSRELALRLNLPETWVRDAVRRRAKDPIPHLRFGKYVRFTWGSPELTEWLERRSSGCCEGGRHEGSESCLRKSEVPEVIRPQGQEPTVLLKQVLSRSSELSLSPNLARATKQACRSESLLSTASPGDLRTSPLSNGQIFGKDSPYRGGNG
jgi:hypothetical protein